MKQLYQSGLLCKDVLELLRLVDWLLNLPDQMEQRFWKELESWEKETRMPYVTSWERIGKRVGREEGQRQALQDAILENLTIDHEHVPKELAEQVRKLADLARLRVLQRASVRAESLEAFRSLPEA